MFATLIESKGNRKNHSRWLPASALFHFALLAAAIAYSPEAHGRRAEPPETPTLVWIAPRRIEVPTTSSTSASNGSGTPQTVARRMPRFSHTPIDLPDVESAILQPDIGSGGHAVTEFGSGPGNAASSGSGAGGVWSATQVEKVALPHPDNRPPDYPRQLHAAGIEGSVLLRFVIDTAGHVEPGSLVVVRSDHPLLTTAVTRALSTHRFLPAEAGGTKVRMLVEQRFEFALGSPQD